jgi:DNA invertase Pin-like site-specific DNA recombinase
MNYLPRDYRQLLRGRPCISYSRFSSRPQEWGDTMRRQREALDDIIAYYSLREDLALMDKAKSASKGRHRTHGQLGDLLKSVELGLIPPGTVIAIEAMDRLHRGGMFDVFDVLKILCKQGKLVLVTGDMTPWDEYTIDSPMNIKLVSEINAAKAGTDRLSGYSLGVQTKKRKALKDYKEASATDPDAIPPHLTALPPAWIVKTETGYAKHPVYATIVERIFDLCIQGNSVRQIAALFNREKVPPFRHGKNGTRTRAEWAAPRIGLLLRNRLVLGLMTPKSRVGKGREDAGPEVKLYPAAIEADIWLKAREMLEVRRKALKGRRGDQVKNLFTGHVFCKTCNAAMRVDSGGGIEKHARVLVCSRFIENRTCKDSKRYDLKHYEPIVLSMLVSEALPPHPANGDAHKLAQELAANRVKITTIQGDIDYHRAQPSSPARREEIDRGINEKNAMLKRVSDLEMKVAAAAAPKSRADDLVRFIEEAFHPALHGDRDARERMRTLLAKLDFRLTGDAERDGMLLQFPISRGGGTYAIGADGSVRTVVPTNFELSLEKLTEIATEVLNAADKRGELL